MQRQVIVVVTMELSLRLSPHRQRGLLFGSTQLFISRVPSLRCCPSSSAQLTTLVASCTLSRQVKFLDQSSHSRTHSRSTCDFSSTRSGTLTPSVVSSPVINPPGIHPNLSALTPSSTAMTPSISTVSAVTVSDQKHPDILPRFSLVQNIHGLFYAQPHHTGSRPLQRCLYCHSHRQDLPGRSQGAGLGAYDHSFQS